ncbi:alpha/beta fold hydrolase [Allosphingosinicella sp.]|uniref:alpha/beta fold hydrolase n=1 Tax=Allosphingosinicella sp. TaxID=2823234 RepID=UPI002F05B0AA
MIRLFLSMMLLPLAAACATLTESAPAAFSSERIGVTVRGEGPDVVLIPGLSSSPEVWDSTIAAVPGYRYHIVHVSGFAGRPAGANANGPVVAPVAEEIARYIAEARLDRPAIVGHSLGGAWGLMIAARHPELVSRLMVVDMMPFIGAMFGGPNATGETLRPVAEQIRQGIATGTGDGRRTATEQMIATMVRTEALRPRAIEHSLASDGPVSGQAMYDLIVTDLRPELRNIRIPLTVLWVHPPGAPVNEAQMAEFYRLSYANAPQARLVRVPNAYHFIMWDEPEAFQRELKAFLAER